MHMHANGIVHCTFLLQTLTAVVAAAGGEMSLFSFQSGQFWDQKRRKKMCVCQANGGCPC